MFDRSETLRSLYRAVNTACVPPLWFILYTIPAAILCFVILWCYADDGRWIFSPDAGGVIDGIKKNLKNVHAAHVLSETIAAISVIIVGMYYLEQYLSVANRLLTDHPFTAEGTRWRLSEPRIDVKKAFMYLWLYIVFIVFAFDATEHGHLGPGFAQSTIVATGIGIWLTAGFGGILLRRQCERIAHAE